ncbi:MAG: T9SS type A sorting domain-containing protein, partial [Bacteroidales bacterium]|nr:T9SS type A sorting domain-containing protein [Bacteroidales bacterium]
ENLSQNFQEINIPKPNLDQIIKANELFDKDALPLKIGVTINVDINIENSGTWTDLGKKGRVWRLKIISKDAKAIGIYYNIFSLPESGKLFLYNKNKTQIIGAFTNLNNPGNKKFATELIKGDVTILEYYEPTGSKSSPNISIEEIAYVYRGVNLISKNLRYGFGDSGPCEVNVKCPEGDNWQNEKKGVAKILLKNGSSLSLCSGSLINNLRQDNQPYFLTANHCGMTASASDYNQWVFYFNYESAECPNPIEEPESNSIVGATLKANAPAGTSFASDFKLLLLNDYVPEEYNPFYNGWDANNYVSPSGTGIHHPYGDIKKISTYLNPVISTPYSSTIEEPDALFWKVVWSETQTNHGVTEGGSSGSPLFNNDRRIIGALTGGAASCQNLTAPDYYGKFSYSWESNGSYDSLQLKPWLDPDNLGIFVLDGIGIDPNSLIPMFTVDTTAVQLGGKIDFTDISIGEPNEWKWIFEGGEPSSSTMQNPSGIYYNSVGEFDVTLIVKNDIITDTLERKDFINVQPVISPNPTNGPIEIFFGKTKFENVSITLFDELGRKLRDYNINNPQVKISINIGGMIKGAVFLRITTNTNSVDYYKLIVI